MKWRKRSKPPQRLTDDVVREAMQSRERVEQAAARLTAETRRGAHPARSPRRAVS